MSSELARVEVLRACRRMDPTALPDARTLLRQLDLVPLAGAVAERASDLEGPTLRSLDALPLSSALQLGETVVLVAYDRRLLEAAMDAWLERRIPAPDRF